MKKGTMSAAVALLLAAGCLGGCSGQETETPTEARIVIETPTETAVEENTKPDASQTFEDLGQTKLTWVYSSNNAAIGNDVQYEVNQYLYDNGYSFYISFESISSTEYAETVQSLIDEGQAPDLISAGIGMSGTLQGTYEAYVYDWLLMLDDYLAGEDGALLKSAMPEKMWKSCEINGHCYGISGSLQSETQYAYYVNMDLAKQYGITEEELASCTIDDLGSVFEKVTDSENLQYLNFNSSSFLECLPEYSIVIGLQNSDAEPTVILDGEIEIIMASQSQTEAICCYNQNDEGNVVNLFTEELALKRFKTLADYYKKGYLSEEKCTNFLISLSTIHQFNESSDEEYIEYLKEQYPDAGEIVAIPYMACPVLTQFNFMNGVCAESQQQELALQALSVVMTDQVLANLLSYGIEGEDYEIMEDGSVEGVSLFSFNDEYFSNQAILSFSQEADEKIKTVEAMMDSMPISPLTGVYIDLCAYGAVIDQIDEVIWEYIGLARGQYEDVDATVAELCGKLEEIGIGEVLDEANAQLAAAREN